MELGMHISFLQPRQLRLHLSPVLNQLHNHLEFPHCSPLLNLLVNLPHNPQAYRHRFLLFRQVRNPRDSHQHNLLGNPLLNPPHSHPDTQALNRRAFLFPFRLLCHQHNQLHFQVLNRRITLPLNPADSHLLSPVNNQLLFRLPSQQITPQERLPLSRVLNHLHNLLSNLLDTRLRSHPVNLLDNLRHNQLRSLLVTRLRNRHHIPLHCLLPSHPRNHHSSLSVDPLLDHQISRRAIQRLAHQANPRQHLVGHHPAFLPRTLHTDHRDLRHRNQVCNRQRNRRPNQALTRQQNHRLTRLGNLPLSLPLVLPLSLLMHHLLHQHGLHQVAPLLSRPRSQLVCQQVNLVHRLVPFQQLYPQLNHLLSHLRNR